MNPPIEYIICSKECYLKNESASMVVVSSISDEDLINKAVELFYKKQFTYGLIPPGGKRFSKKEIKNMLSIRKLSPPSTYPKFNNEKPFKLVKGFLVKPFIKKIRWDGKKWEYLIMNIGHENGDWVSEESIEKNEYIDENSKIIKK